MPFNFDKFEIINSNHHMNILKKIQNLIAMNSSQNICYQ